MNNTTDNPFAAPALPPETANESSRTHAELRSIARWRVALHLCAVAQLGLFLFGAASMSIAFRQVASSTSSPTMTEVTVPVSETFPTALSIAPPLMIVSGVVTFVLASKVYHITSALVLGTLAVIPAWGFLMLVWVDWRAARVLRLHGARAGFFANKLPPLREEEPE